MIKINGDEKFKKIANEALELLRSKLPAEYRFVEREVNSIKLAPNAATHIVLSIGTLCVNNITDAKWFASVMVREAHIRELYMKLDEERTMPCKMFALFKQIEVLKKLRAVKLAAYARSLFGKSELPDPPYAFS